MTDISVPRVDVKKEKKRKFFSRLPIRTWKRLRTKEPAALRPERDATNDVKLQKVENETAKLNNHLEKTENVDIHTKDRTTTINSNDIKRSERFGTGSPSVDKSGLTSSDLKSIKRIKDFNATRRTYEQWKKRTSIK
ncbi:uncharacterized protein [Mycetomoellerius zeteki]|uniref:uncharacterized protein n=1 Tax=Mycetomoellerius zeteki TaxID=64791 RepID=UPI00084E380F|nr:PREDICTED: uncharacterized protein LOC108728143 [Trachymyrmex zeteki]